MAPELHRWLAYGSAVAMALAGLAGAWAVARDTAPGPWAARLQAAVLIALVATLAGGLGILVGGGRPREILHFVYAVLALAALPLADSLTRSARPRVRGLAWLVGALVGLVVIARLFGTG
jgi:hypothetical protein